MRRIQYKIVYVLSTSCLVNIQLSCDFLAKVVTGYIKICYEKSLSINFLAFIRSCVLLA